MTATTDTPPEVVRLRGGHAPTLPGYRLLDQLGEGGMGVVYRAVDERTGREVALKLLSSGSDLELASRRFRREFRAAARLRHPHVAQVFDMHAEPPLYYTLELVDGVSLDRILLPKLGNLGDIERMGRVIAMVGQVLVALEVVHSAELVHRDLKPENILVTRLPPGAPLPFDPPALGRRYYQPDASGERLFVKLVDFGLAWVGDQSGDLTKTGIIVGTVDYVSPEQVLGGEVDQRADLYSLGVVLYELIAGRPPFAARDTVSLLLKHAYEEPAPPTIYNPMIDAGLEAFTLRLLAKDPADRFPSAREALAALAGGHPSQELRRSSVTIRLTPRPQGLLPPRFVGRDADLKQAREAVAAVKAGTPRVLLVSGEAGIGKSRLLEEVKKTARMQGLLVAAGGAHDQQNYAFAAFLPVIEAFAREAEHLPRDRALVAIAETLARLHPCFRDFLPEGAALAPRPGAEEERYRVLAAMTELTRRLAERQGILILLEDLHWADPSSLELFSYLLRNLENPEGSPASSARVLLAISLRDEEIEPGGTLARWRDAVKRSGATRELHLDRLGRPEVEAIARSMLGNETVPGEVLSWVFAQSQGVPFLVGEMLGAFAAEGALVLGGSRLELKRKLSGEIAFPQALPPPVAELVSRRLDKLAERERKVAAAAAIVGAEVPFDLLLAASGLEEDELLDALQVLLSRRILVESHDDPDLFVFSSKVLRDVLTEETFERRRRRAHERIAQALEARSFKRPEDVIGLAHHWLLGGHKVEGLGYLIRAARFHRDRLHHDQALAAARRALDLIENEPGLAEPAVRLELLGEVGELESALCVYERAAAAFSVLVEGAAAQGLSDLRARGLLGLAEIDIRRGEYAEAERRAREVLRLAREAGASAVLGRAHTSLGRVAWHLGRSDEALAAFTESFAVERARGDGIGQAKALHNIGYAHFARGDFAEAELCFEQGLIHFRAHEHPLGIARGLEAKATVAQRRGTYGDGARALAEARSIMRRVGDRRGEAYCVVSEGNIHAYRGEWLEALKLYDQAEETFAELGETRGLAFCASNRGRVLTSIGDFGGALEAIGRALKLARKIAEKGEVAFCRYALAELFRELGAGEEAARHDVDAIELFREQGERYGLGLAIAGASLSLAGRGDPQAAGRAEEALALALEAGGMPEVEVRARLAIGRARALPEEAAHAARVASAAGLRELAAFALGAQADLLREGGQAEISLTVRREAVTLVEDLAAGLEDRRAIFLRRPAILAILVG